MADKPGRQQRILELLAHNRIQSQEQLQDLLLAEDLACSQTTLSRDLRELGVVKSAEGYRALGGSSVVDGLARLAREIAPRLRASDAGGSVAVLRPDGGSASSVARAIEAARLPQVVAAVASDGVVLVVTRTPADSRRLISALRSRR